MISLIAWIGLGYAIAVAFFCFLGINEEKKKDRMAMFGVAIFCGMACIGIAIGMGLLYAGERF